VWNSCPDCLHLSVTSCLYKIFMISIIWTIIKLSVVRRRVLLPTELESQSISARWEPQTFCRKSLEPKWQCDIVWNCNACLPCVSLHASSPLPSTEIRTFCTGWASDASSVIVSYVHGDRFNSVIRHRNLELNIFQCWYI
jgi:hypothetical protein